MDRPEDFQARRDTYLAGLTDTHVALFEAFQPYNGVEWTRVLWALSNPDKHRELVTMTVHATQTIVISYAGAEWEPDDSLNMVIRTGRTEGPEVHMKVGLTVQIAFDDGAPIIETLQMLQLKVAETIELFKPEFEGTQGGLGASYIAAREA